MKLDELPRRSLARLPTPVHKLPRLGSQLGVELWIKRDDLTGLAFGGNKTRKLEFLLADAEEQGADTLVTIGAVQSNHCRQTAAAAAASGFGCLLLLMGEEPEAWGGNVLLDQILGAEIQWVEPGDREAALSAAVRRAADEGRRPYLIPYGGSNPLGVSAYALALGELLAQDLTVDRIVHGSSSGGTQAGLILGATLHSFQGEITGISVEPTAAKLSASISALLNETTAFLGLDPSEVDRSIEVVDRYLGGGYGVVGELEREAISLFARSEGLLLDPVYTGRAAGGMIDMIERGEINAGEKVLFWHTGGTPALFAYGQEIS